ncbi:GNAT family N-acetyltransferase [Paenibacillus puerhi]|uniref:GNAT family N-acetyltransferase n=1 Tax=Paenibacillus puerhi TaxID=2692622 RepID=UPI001F2B7A48|nr:GNAT family N-acetyltransferase [Paenibacillus puerhi]
MATLKENVNGIKENMERIKQSIDQIKDQAQVTMEAAKDTAAEMKEKIGKVKESVQEMKASVAQAKEELKSTGAAAAAKVAASTSVPDHQLVNTLELELEKAGNGFVIREAGKRIGEITYAPIDSFTWVLNHTYVTPEYRGRDIAQRLLRRVAEEARSEGKKIVPTCSYAAVQFKRHAEYADVWKQS